MSKLKGHKLTEGEALSIASSVGAQEFATQLLEFCGGWSIGFDSALNYFSSSLLPKTFSPSGFVTSNIGIALFKTVASELGEADCAFIARLCHLNWLDERTCLQWIGASGFQRLIGFEQKHPLAGQFDDTGRFSFSPLFRELFYHHCLIKGKVQTDKLHLSTASDLEFLGYIDQAVYHALRAGDRSMARAILERAGGWRYALTATPLHLNAALGHFHESELLSDPALLLALAFAQNTNENSLRGLSLLKKRMAMGAETPAEELELECLHACFLTYAESPPPRRTFERLIDLCAGDGIEITQLRCMVNCAAAAASQFNGEFKLAEVYLAATDYDASVSGLPFFRSLNSTGRILNSLRRGRLNEAEQHACILESFLDGLPREAAPVKVALDSLRFLIEYWRGHQAVCPKVLDDAITVFSNSYSWRGLLNELFRTRFKIALNEELASAKEVSSRFGSLGIITNLPARQIVSQAWIAQAYGRFGDPVRAAQSVEFFRLEEEWHRGSLPPFALHEIGCALAEIAFLQRKYVDATKYLLELKKAAITQDRLIDLAGVNAQLCCVARARNMPAFEEQSASDLIKIHAFSEANRVIVGNHPELASILTRHLRKNSTNTAAEIVLAQMYNANNAGFKKNLIISYQLTAAEYTVYELASKGLTNKEIARAIGRSDHTVKYHLGNIFKKLGISNRRQLPKL